MTRNDAGVGGVTRLRVYHNGDVDADRNGDYVTYDDYVALWKRFSDSVPRSLYESTLTAQMVAEAESKYAMGKR